MSTVVLYCWCRSDSASVLLYFTLIFSVVSVNGRVRLEAFIRDAFLNKQEVVSVFFDLEKAYDKTWFHGILKENVEPRRTLKFRFSKNLVINIGILPRNPAT